MNGYPIHGCGIIPFCFNTDCKNTNCERNPKNILVPYRILLPYRDHSFAPFNECKYRDTPETYAPSEKRLKWELNA